MRYLYGDSSSFPLNQNFLVTLAAATDCCVSLLRVDELLGSARQTADQANSAAMKEIADIDQLIQRLERALAQRDHLSSATTKVVEQVGATAKAQFDKARRGISAWRDGTVRKAHQGCGPADMMAPLHRFLVKHELPYTSWGLRWKSGKGEEPVQAQVYAIMQRGLTATLGVAIPARHFWAEPVKLSMLEKKLAVKLVGKNWLGQEKLRDEHLDRYYITRITRTSERHAMILSKRPKEQVEGLRVSFREGDTKRVTIQRIDDNENPLGEPVTVEGADGALLKRVWRRIEETIADLIHYRSQLLAATLYGKRITELESPSTVAVAIIQSIAPLVRDLKRHSRTPGELQLKRDLGDGRREELFIPAAEISGKYQALSPENQALFDCFGLTKAAVPQSSEPHIVRPSQPALEPQIATPQAPSSQPQILPAAPSSSGPSSAPASERRSSPRISRPAASRPGGDADLATSEYAADEVPSYRGQLETVPEDSRLPGYEPEVAANYPSMSSTFPPPAGAHAEMPSVPPPSRPPRRRANTADTPVSGARPVPNGMAQGRGSVPPPSVPARRASSPGSPSVPSPSVPSPSVPAPSAPPPKRGPRRRRNQGLRVANG